MTPTRRDLRRLGLPLALTVMLIAIGGLLGWNSYRAAVLAERDRDAALAARNQVEQRVRRAVGEGQEIRSRLQTVDAWRAAGILGKERRLDWLEMLRDIQRDLRLPGMKYEFGPQTRLDSGSTGNPAWAFSPQKIQFRLLHEEDLLNALARIQQDARALVIVRQCTLSPLASRNAGAGATALLGAECELQWLTIPGIDAERR